MAKVYGNLVQASSLLPGFGMHFYQEEHGVVSTFLVEVFPPFTFNNEGGLTLKIPHVYTWEEGWLRQMV